MRIGTRNGPRRSSLALALGVTLSAGAWATAAHTAHACSFPFPCPVSRTLPDHGGRLPANLHGFLWRPPCTGEPADHRAELKALTPDGVTQMLEWSMAPAGNPDLQYVQWTQELPRGTQLVFSYDEPNPERVPGRKVDDADAGIAPLRHSVELFITPAAPIPTRLGGMGSTTAYGSFPLSSIDGDCSHAVQASYVDVEALPGYDAAPFEDVLYYETRVDGEPWRPYRESLTQTLHEWLGGSALGRTRDRVYLPCALPDHSPAQFAEVAEVLASGHHSISVVGFLPDGTALETMDYEFELTCPDATHVGDAREVLPDAAVGSGTQSAGRAAGAIPAADSGGCSLVRPGAPAQSGHALAWLALAGLVRLRVRARRASG